jgi:muconolactone D-isomerase
LKFLVQITVDLSALPPEPQRAQLLQAELERGRELLDSGSIWAIWRLPGGLRNVGIWEVRDATELHDLIASLPLFNWLTADVTPLAEHPLNRSTEG